MILEYTMTLEIYHNHQTVDSCASEIAVYVVNHDNWPQPILPGEGDCPDMQFVPERFDHRGNFWKCGDSSYGK